jgi:hypothetical protein
MTAPRPPTSRPLAALATLDDAGADARVHAV